MSINPTILPEVITAIAEVIENNAAEVTALDQAIGDGDHVINLQRGIKALLAQRSALAELDWPQAWQKIAMTLMSSVGGASGSLYGTFFLTLSINSKAMELNLENFSRLFSQGVESVKQRGKADAGEKTMLDVLIPVAEVLQQSAQEKTTLPDLLENVAQTAIAGMEATRDMLATKGRASFLGERTRGHIDAGAKTMQLMICALLEVIKAQSAAPS